MKNLNYDFFEEFKHLEKLCGELYGTKNGVTSYIDHMKSVSEYDYRNVPNWKTDLGQLIRLRHIRNHLAHTEGAFQEIACTKGDIDWLRAFYKRIQSQSDPIAILYKTRRTLKPMNTYMGPQGFNQSGDDISPLWTKVLNAIIILLVIAFIGGVIVNIFI